MGVYIKDEKMPDTCIECFKHNKCDRYHIEILKNEDGDYIPQYIADNCPLVEVKTPHGRLIDADDVNERIRKKLGIRNLDYLLEAEKPISMSIKESPTVIEAEVE